MSLWEKKVSCFNPVILLTILQLGIKISYSQETEPLGTGTLYGDQIKYSGVFSRDLTIFSWAFGFSKKSP
jgi:hypothetical protein